MGLYDFAVSSLFFFFLNEHDYAVHEVGRKVGSESFIQHQV